MVRIERITRRSEECLSLRDAAVWLGVHPTTLRRWADHGEIPMVLTPSGHRYFSMAVLDQFIAQHRHQQASLCTEHVDNSSAVQEQGQLFRRRMMGLILLYLSMRTGTDALIEEARAIGRNYARSIIECDQPIISALEVTMTFHDVMVEIATQIPEIAHVTPESTINLLQRIGAILYAVQLGIADTYYDRHAKLSA